MTTTILAVLALAGPLVPGVKPEFQAQTDYGQAMKVATSEKKPMAVLIGKGDVFTTMMRDTALTADAKKLLTEKYVCVSVNVETEAGKKLAEQFDLTSGLVISSVGGTHQALRQSGAVSASDLAKHAGTYATASGVPSTTVTVGKTVYQPSAAPPAPPIYSAPPSVYPAGGYSLPRLPYSPGLPCVGNRSG
jgi:hypothetical protein